MPAPSPRPACLVLHGLGGGPYEVQPLIEAIEGAGFEVSAPVLPGHDGPGPTMPVSSWVDWAAAAASAFDRLAGSGRPVAVVGFSTGGTLALDLATTRPVDRLVLLAPFFAIRYSHLVPIRPSRYLGVVSRFLPNLPRRGPAVRDRAAGRLLGTSSRYRTFSLGATLSALELIERVEARLDSIGAPTLILQGRRDSVVEGSGAVRLLDRLGSADKSIRWFERSDHLLALDFDRADVIAAALGFLGGSL